MSIQALRHVGITVSDMKRSVRFYCDYLGLSVSTFISRCEGEYISTLVGIPNVCIDICLLQAPDGSRIELLQYLSHPGAAGACARANEPGRPHCAFTVANIRELYDRREQFDCKFEHPPQPSKDGVLVAYCHDPDGTILELVQPMI
ncbi:MAG TPA: VOC family protein [Pyrinomonadaceae bacterium]|nr:VOC family protein [Pyrinomonadaceae bacterium]